MFYAASPPSHQSLLGQFNLTWYSRKTLRNKKLSRAKIQYHTDRSRLFWHNCQHTPQETEQMTNTETHNINYNKTPCGRHSGYMLLVNGVLECGDVTCWETTLCYAEIVSGCCDIKFCCRSRMHEVLHGAHCYDSCQQKLTVLFFLHSRFPLEGYLDW